MRKSTTLVLACLVVLGAGLGSALASERIVTPRPTNDNGPLGQFGFRVPPHGNIIQILPTSRLNIDYRFNVVYVTCDGCGGACPPRHRKLTVRLQATRTVAAGWGVSNLVTSGYGVLPANITYDNSTQLNPTDTVDIVIDGDADACGTWFSVWLDICDVAPAAPTDACAADVLINEAFMQPEGAALAGRSPSPGPGGVWTNNTGTPNQILVSGGKIALNQANSEDLRSSFAHTWAAGETIYAGFDLTVPDAPPSIELYFAHFGITGGSHTARIYTKAGTGSTFQLGIAASATPVSYSSGDVPYGTYRVVSSYGYTSGTAQLWIYDSSGVQVGATASNTGTAGRALNTYCVREITGATSHQVIDNLLVAMTFDLVK